MRKRLTIGLSGFAVVATGCFFGGRAIYRNRKAKKLARAAAKKEEPIVTEPVMPVIPPTPEPSHPEVAAAAVEAEAVPEKVEEAAPEKVEEVAPVEKEEAAPVEAEAAPVEGEAAPKEEQAEPAEKEEVPASVEEEKYHPWWEGVKEISVFLPADEIEKLDSKFPATRQYKFVLIRLLMDRPQRKVMLAYNPKPEDANEYGPVMSDEVEMKVIAMVSDEHAQVVGSFLNRET